MAETGYYISDSRLWDFVPRLLHTDSTLDISTNNLIEITICQNPTFDPGNQDNQYTVELSGGQETHDIPNSEFVQQENMHVWIRIDFTIEDTSSEASVASAEIESEGGFIYGFVRDSTGQGIQDALVKAINSNDVDTQVSDAEANLDTENWTTDDQVEITGDIEGYATKSDDEGKYRIEPTFDGENQKMFHLAARYSDTNNEYNAISKPFIGVEPALPIYTEEVMYPVGEPLFWWPFSGAGATGGYSFATLEGAQKVRGNWFNGYAVSGNGTDQYVSTHNWGSFGNQMDSNFCIGFTIETTATTGSVMGSIDTGGNQSQTIILSMQAGFSGAEGNLTFAIRSDGSDLTTYNSVDSLATINDGNKHRVVCVKSSNQASGMSIYVDGEETEISINSDTFDPTQVKDFDSTLTLLARSLRDGSVDSYLDGTLDDVVVYGNSLSYSQIHNDYARQPWNDAEMTNAPESGIVRLTFDDADTESGTALDVWGGNHATINGATTGVTGANQTYTTNEAYSFDGSNDSVTASITDLDTATIAGWGNVVPQSQLSYNNSGFIQYVSSGADDPLEIRASDGNYRFIVNAGGSSTQFRSTNNPRDTWAHFAITWDGSEMRGYINGSLEGSDTSISGNLDASGVLNIGVLETIGNYGNEQVDDVRVYGKALSSTEISNLYETGSIVG